MKTMKARLSRRNFLLAGAGTAAGAAAIVSTSQVETGPSKKTAGEPTKGYQLTEHVRNYYRTAKI